MSTAEYRKDKAFYKQFLDASTANRFGKNEEIRTTPLFSLAVQHAVDGSLLGVSPSSSIIEGSSTDSSDTDDTYPPISPEAIEAGPSCEKTDRFKTSSNGVQAKRRLLPQFGLLGFHIGDDKTIGDDEPIMLNVDAPNSTFICGSQGSGKSYTLSCMLENFLLKNTEVGKMESPVAGVVFHYDLDCASSVAEAAYLCSQGIEVNVLVSQSNERALKQAYDKIGAQYGNNNLKVQPLLLRSADLSIERMIKLMALAEKEGPVPLYMEVIQRILRHMAIQGTTTGTFDYKHFRSLLAAERLTREQLSPLNLRFGLLESFMHPDDIPRADVPNFITKKKKTATASAAKLFKLKPGSLTIIDLSDPFVDASTVCILFDICLSLIKEQRSSPLIVALDEAHKFMNSSLSAAKFTDRLLTTIREQRHNATRVIISTQEPTVDPRLLDLCSTTIVHRFTSPTWFGAIKEHLAGASSMVEDLEGRSEMFGRIVELGVGESLVFCPGAWVRVMGDEEGVGKLGGTAMKMLTRARMGADGGMSLLASEMGEKLGGG